GCSAASADTRTDKNSFGCRHRIRSRGGHSALQRSWHRRSLFETRGSRRNQKAADLPKLLSGRVDSEGLFVRFACLRQRLESSEPLVSFSIFPDWFASLRRFSPESPDDWTANALAIGVDLSGGERSTK